MSSQFFAFILFDMKKYHWTVQLTLGNLHVLTTFLLIVKLQCALPLLALINIKYVINVYFFESLSRQKIIFNHCNGEWLDKTMEAVAATTQEGISSQKSAQLCYLYQWGAHYCGTPGYKLWISVCHYTVVKNLCEICTCSICLIKLTIGTQIMCNIATIASSVSPETPKKK